LVSFYTAQESGRQVAIFTLAAVRTWNFTNLPLPLTCVRARARVCVVNYNYTLSLFACRTLFQCLPLAGFHGKKNSSTCLEKTASEEWRTDLHTASTAIWAVSSAWWWLAWLLSTDIMNPPRMKERDKDDWSFSLTGFNASGKTQYERTNACLWWHWTGTFQLHM
jgi:hypothetical protein